MAFPFPNGEVSSVYNTKKLLLFVAGGKCPCYTCGNNFIKKGMKNVLTLIRERAVVPQPRRLSLRFHRLSLAPSSKNKKSGLNICSPFRDFFDNVIRE
jgi:hypothetical protein